MYSIGRVVVPIWIRGVETYQWWFNVDETRKLTPLSILSLHRSGAATGTISFDIIFVTSTMLQAISYERSWIMDFLNVMATSQREKFNIIEESYHAKIFSAEDKPGKT